MNLFLAAAIHLYVLLRLVGKFVAITLLLPFILAKRGFFEMPFVPAIVSLSAAALGSVGLILAPAVILDASQGVDVPAWAWTYAGLGIYFTGPATVAVTIYGLRLLRDWFKGVYAAELLEVRKPPKPRNCACDG